MSSSDNARPDRARTKRVRRKINPATAPIEELCAHLATDPTAGLSPKEAERRRIHSTAMPLFQNTTRRFADCLKRVVREPALWLLLAVAIISLFFDRLALGLVCILMAAGNAALCAYLLWRAERIDAAMQAYDAPLCRVLRNRRICRMGPDAVVKGDILLLYKGDLVPADCRLVSADGLIVSEREIDGSASDRPAVLLKKDADAIPHTAGNYRVSPENMVFAGGVVEAGFAVAVVVAVGSETHLGGLVGRVHPAHTKRVPALFTKAARYLSVYDLGLVFLVIPVTAVGIFTLGDRYELLDIFLSALALASVTLTEHLLAKGLYMAAALRRTAATDRDGTNTADVKTSAVTERLTAMTDLLLVGTAALHDGKCHPEALRIGASVYRCDRPEADETARSVAELLFLYHHAMRTLPDTYGTGERCGFALAEEVAALIPAVCDWAEADTDALLVKVKELRLEADGVSGILPSSDGNRRVTVRLTADIEELRACRALWSGVRSAPSDEEALNDLYRAYRSAVRTGYRAVFLLTREDGKSMVRAMLTYAPHTCRKTAGCIKSLEAAGIRTAAFLRNASDENTRVLAECGLTERAPAHRPAPEEADSARTPAADLMDGGCRAFEGCSAEYIMTCIRDLQAAGRTVGVLSVDGEDVALFNAADVAFTCSPSLYLSAEAGDPHPTDEETAVGALPNAPDGRPDGRCATDLCRRRADVIVRRSAEGGGGVCGVRRALLSADSFKNALDRSFGFLLVSQLVRLISVVIPLCFGLALTTAPALLLSGLGVDLLVVLASASLPAPSAPSPRRSVEDGLTRPWLTYRSRLIAAAVAMAVSWLMAGIARLLDVSFGADLAYYGILCILGVQLAIFRADHLPKRDRTAFFATLALALLYVGALAAALGAGLTLLWSLLLPPIAPLVYVLSKCILERILGEEKKGSTPSEK